MAYRTEKDKDVSKLQPPHSLEAEQAVLGSILKDEEALHRVIEILDSEVAFYVPKHQMIYRAVLQLFEDREPCDLTMVANRLADKGNLERIGGRVYLVDLVEYVTSTANADKYADIVLEKYLVRRLIETSNEIARGCYDLADDVDSLLDQAERSIFYISEKRLRKGFTSISDLMPKTFEEIDNLHSPESSLVGVRSGFTELDVLTNGLIRGDLIIVAGRPSMGKSALAMNIAEHIAVDQNKAVGIFSLEMSKEQLAIRMLCGRARVSQQKLRADKLPKEDWAKLGPAGGTLSEAPIFIDDSPTLTSLEIRAKARRLKSQHDVSLIIIDYMQMAYGSGRFENRQQEIASISRGLKALAKEIDIPVLACSQLSRQVEQRGGEKRPQLSDLRESGAIEQDADVVMFIYRPEHYLSHLDKTDPKYVEVQGRAEIIVAKQRNGPTGIVNLQFEKDFARFRNLAPGYREIPADVEPIDGGDVPF